DPRFGGGQHDEAIEQVASLWRQFHLLGQMLAEPDPRWIQRAPPPASENLSPKSLVERTKVVEAGLATLCAAYQELAGKLAGGELPPDWQALQRTLSVPHPNLQLRERLVARQLEAAQEGADLSTSPAAAPQADPAEAKAE